MSGVLHAVPKDRESLSTGDWFPYVLAKLAPLEEWNVILSPEDLVRDRYNSDFEFQLAKQDTWTVPRFCFHFFRIEPQALSRLFIALDSYHGAVIWSPMDSCISAFVQRPQFEGVAPTQENIPTVETLKRWEDAIRNPPKPDPEFVKKAVADIPHLCQYLETQMGLADREPKDFDTEVLAKEALANSPGTFENFVERGDHMPTLTIPGQPIDFRRDGRHQPSFGVGMFEMGDLLVELGSAPGARRDEPSAPEYPLLSRLDDVASDAVYEPKEANKLLAEVTRAQTVAKRPSSIRALDKLYRIAKWAERDGSGIFFNGQ